MEIDYDSVTMSSLQEQVKQAEIRKGHIFDNILAKMFVTVEELGELAKAMRIYLKMRTHSKTARYNLEDEFGDVLFPICGMANRCNVSLAKALMCKIAKDEKKVYKPDDGTNN